MKDRLKVRLRIDFPRDVLLIEIKRDCANAQCNARTRIGLVKEEALAYTGFVCEGCEEWNADVLSERDIPEWWEELYVIGLAAVRPHDPAPPAETGEVVTRLSEAWRQTHTQLHDGDGDPAPGNDHGEN